MICPYNSSFSKAFSKGKLGVQLVKKCTDAQLIHLVIRAFSTLDPNTILQVPEVIMVGVFAKIFSWVVQILGKVLKVLVCWKKVLELWVSAKVDGK